MNQKIKFMQEKFNLEQAVVNCFRHNHDLTDYSVQRVFKLMQDMLKRGDFTFENWKTYQEMTEQETMLFVTICRVCAWCLGSESQYGKILAEQTKKFCEEIEEEEENIDWYNKLDEEEDDDDWDDWDDEDEEEWANEEYNDLINMLGKALYEHINSKNKRKEEEENGEDWEVEDDEDGEDEEEDDDDWDDEDEEEDDEEEEEDDDDWDDEEEDDDDDWDDEEEDEEEDDDWDDEEEDDDDDWDDEDEEEDDDWADDDDWEDYEAVWDEDEEEDQEKPPNENPLNLEEMIECLNDLEKSINRWTRQGGRQGYLTFINGMFH